MADLIIDGLRLLLIAAGVGFFVVGSIGLLRFPDVYTRIHALTKADNLGLGLIVLGLLIGVDSVAAGAKLVLIWLLALLASASAGYLVARAARRRGVKAWQAAKPVDGTDHDALSTRSLSTPTSVRPKPFNVAHDSLVEGRDGSASTGSNQTGTVNESTGSKANRRGAP